VARFVLVHGGFHGAWCWEWLRRELEAAGHTTTAFDLPGGGDDATPPAGVTLATCADRVRAVLAAEPEPVVLVGHSMGGIVVTQAADDRPGPIAAVVHVAAFLPGDGQSLVSLKAQPEGAGDIVQPNLVVTGDPPVAALPPDIARQAFYGACDDERAAWALERLGPQALAPFRTPVRLTHGATDGPPRHYVRTARDRAIPPALQERMVREQATGEVAELDTDHSPFLSAPAELAALLGRLA
jgi:pimeloyl-ACP methyl ester carboxylesterase